MEPDFTFPYLCRRNGFRRYVDVSYATGKLADKECETMKEE